MAGRKLDPKAEYRMMIHEANHYLYAATVKTEYKDGKRIRRYVHWGTLSRDLVFTPNAKFLTAPQMERNAFIYPSDWDVSGVRDLPERNVNWNGAGTRSQQKVIDGDAQKDIVQPKGNGYFELQEGASWFLTKLAGQRHVVEDLLKAFGGDFGIVNDILAVAIFPCLTGRRLECFTQGKMIAHYPANHVISPEFVEEMMHRISKQNARDFRRLRIEHLKEVREEQEVSVLLSWGKHMLWQKDGQRESSNSNRSKQEAILYEVKTGEPIDCRAFSEDETDFSMAMALAKEWKENCSVSLATVMNKENVVVPLLQEYYKHDLPFISDMKARQKFVEEFLLDVEYDEHGLPRNMVYHEGSRLFQKQIAMKSQGMYCNLYLDPAKRPFDLIALENEIREEHEKVHDLKGEEISDNLEKVNRSLFYHKVSVHQNPKKNDWIVVIKEDKKAIQKARAACGFLVLISHRISGNTEKILNVWNSRKVQESLMRESVNQTAFDAFDYFRVERREGWEFLSLVSEILRYCLREAWRKSPKLHECFRSPDQMLKEMADACLTRQANGEEQIIPVRSEQTDICRECGLI